MNRVVTLTSVLLIFAAFYSTTHGATFLELGTRNEAYPNKCYSRSFNLAMKIGKEYQTPGTCGAMSCSKSFTIEIRTCGKIEVENCTLSEEDLSKPYPECCPQPICD